MCGMAECRPNGMYKHPAPPSSLLHGNSPVSRPKLAKKPKTSEHTKALKSQSPGQVGKAGEWRSPAQVSTAGETSGPASAHPHGAYSPTQQISPLHKARIHLHGTCKAVASQLSDLTAPGPRLFALSGLLAFVAAEGRIQQVGPCMR